MRSSPLRTNPLQKIARREADQVGIDVISANNRALSGIQKALLRGLCLAGVLSVAGCGFYQQKPSGPKDSGPKRPLNVAHIPDPTPRYELRTEAGNKSPYKVLGKKYRVLDNPIGYKERGLASWYGNKFHGRKTSNGEIYNMYGMTAAHKTLPIPSYVRVTNLSNDKSVIVRVNDRGPFHSGRIIDLTYTAARKLGVAAAGTGEVLVEYIDTSKHASQSTPVAGKTSVAVGPSTDKNGYAAAPAPDDVAGYGLPPNTYLQVGAFSQQRSAEALKGRLSALTDHAVDVVAPSAGGKALYRVYVGPFTNNYDLLGFRKTLADQQLPKPHVVRR